MGVHCCAEGDWAAVAATGPTILSVPVDVAVVDVAGHLSSFLDAGGWMRRRAPTDRPVATASDRYLRDLSCSVGPRLVRQGCDPARLRNQALVTPACGLALHDEAQAALVLRLTNEVAARVREQSTKGVPVVV